MKNKSMELKNYWIVDCDRTLFGDVQIVDGKIANIIERKAQGTMGEGVLMPAFIDLHAHFREPGYTYKEDIESGSEAAAKGGYTHVTLMANTNPVCDNMEVLNIINNRNKEIGLIDINQCIAGTSGLMGDDYSHLEGLDSEKVKCISDDGKGVMNDKVMRSILNICNKKEWIFMSHAEDSSADNMRDAENNMTERDVQIAKEVDGRLHMCHVSTREAIDVIRSGKKNGVNVTCEVTPHHIMNPEGISDYRVNPPIRENQDVMEIIKGINDGTVDAIATDHAPHTLEDKKNGAPGISGIEFAFPICYSELVKSGKVTLNKLSELMSSNPAKILNLKKGKIKEGYDGDIAIVNLKKTQLIKEENIVSRGKNTPLLGREFYGVIEATIKNGEFIYRREK
ncbi:dihydroorotase [Oceanirhabdus sp. W0125-5]|uniref:dihydroorotase n=1 Tax=Oceanirhabdus sp. W0125-5 TaxID=2999116 RepID=UPI0022F2BADD|nr:dihydroorotase [Oceanirhabdus sp. W0125-5]WBW98906.1 dihydroorotase [Oceanirhabdus sp. W0125-5]